MSWLGETHLSKDIKDSLAQSYHLVHLAHINFHAHNLGDAFDDFYAFHGGGEGRLGNVHEEDGHASFGIFDGCR
jgi:hypothetical protein